MSDFLEYAFIRRPKPQLFVFKGMPYIHIGGDEYICKPRGTNIWCGIRGDYSLLKIEEKWMLDILEDPDLSKERKEELLRGILLLKKSKGKGSLIDDNSLFVNATFARSFFSWESNIQAFILGDFYGDPILPLTCFDAKDPPILSFIVTAELTCYMSEGCKIKVYEDKGLIQIVIDNKYTRAVKKENSPTVLEYIKEVEGK